MPFDSKAQQRYLFATDKAVAKEKASKTKDYSKLPEKKHPSINPEGRKLPPKTASDGMFFQKSARARGGNFFRDLPGRADATFHEKTAMAADSPDGPKPPPIGANPAATTATPPIQQGKEGEEMGGGMYGTGSGTKKKAAAAPSDWDADVGIPTGFHRPATEQPEALETGGERFHSTEAKAIGNTQRHGLVEGGSMHAGGLTGHQMGKHASARFLGTSFNKTAMNYTKAEDYAKPAGGYASDRLSEAGESMKTLGKELGGHADKAVRGITSSPVATGIAALVAAKLGMGAIKGVGRGAARLVGRKKAPPPSLAGGALSGLRKMITGR